MDQQHTKKLAVVDLDGTLIRGQSQEMLISYLYSQKRVSLWYVLRLKAFFVLYRLHLIEGVEKAYAIALGFLRGMNVFEAGALIDVFIQNSLKGMIYPKAPDFLHKLKADGYDILILSTAVSPIVSRMAELLGADAFVSTELVIVGGSYTGTIAGEVISGPNKSTALERYMRENGYDAADTRAYADRESDIPLLKMVGAGYIANPDARMARIAKSQNLDIIDLR